LDARRFTKIPVEIVRTGLPAGFLFAIDPMVLKALKIFKKPGYPIRKVSLEALLCYNN
jgi:hypothetical protein